MASAQELRHTALAFKGTIEAPHFDRAAFRVARTYATLAADGLTANLKLAPDEQELKCLTVPEAFAPVPNKWGQQGWTTARLTALSLEQLAHALELAWLRALPPPEPKRRPKPTRR